MAVGPRGQSGRLVLSLVVEGPKRELGHVPNHCHNMEVPFVVVTKNKHGHVEPLHVQVSIWPNIYLAVC